MKETINKNHITTISDSDDVFIELILDNLHLGLNTNLVLRELIRKRIKNINLTTKPIDIVNKILDTIHKEELRFPSSVEQNYFEIRKIVLKEIRETIRNKFFEDELN
jgi:hypothetical protein